MKNENQHFSADRRKFGRHFWIGAAVAGALSAAVIFTAASAVYRKNRFDLKIGEEKVGSKEYQLCMDLVKYDVLADHTVEKIKYIHVVYDLAEEYGDVSDGSFAAIEKRWKQENAKRQKKVEDGEVIYGLKEYTFDLYMQYEISMYKEIYCNDTDRKGMDLTEEEVAEYYSQGEWVFQDDGEKADLETARIAVERELREKKYDAMIAQMTEDLEVSGDLEAVDRFTLDHLKR